MPDADDTAVNSLDDYEGDYILMRFLTAEDLHGYELNNSG